MNNKTITFGAAQKKPGAFSLMLKPVGSTCNLRCSYCYYLPTGTLYGNHTPVMSQEVLQMGISQFLETLEIPIASFCWHGGEPLIAGKDFFRKAIEFQNQYSKGIEIQNSLQTNGILIDEEWCEFFRENHFLIGLSIDGTQSIHDANRRDTFGNETFNRTIRAAQMMAKYGVDFNILCTVNSHSVNHGKEIYRFLRTLTPFIQFLPVGSPEKFAVSGKDFGQFLCEVYDEWRNGDIGRIYIQLFDNTLALWCGYPSTICTMGETCGETLTIEHNGDVYCCDHFVDKDHCIGNIKETHLKELASNQNLFDFIAAKYSSLPTECKKCKWQFLCNGECPEHRTVQSIDGTRSLNVFCEGYKKFFKHTENDMRQMREYLFKGLAPSLIQQTRQ